MNLSEWQREVHEVAKSHGWWDSNGDHSIPSKLCLIHSEVSEALEEFRTNNDQPDRVYFAAFNNHDWSFEQVDEYQKPEGFGVELADAMIRIMDLAEWLGIDLERMVSLKNEYNKTRPYRHGGKTI